MIVTVVSWIVWGQAFNPTPVASPRVAPIAQGFDTIPRAAAPQVWEAVQPPTKLKQGPRVTYRNPSARRAGALTDYLSRIQSKKPYARISGTFSEYRAASADRPVAGLHNGYDIALDLGDGVPCGWAGRVTRIVPWSADQYGITVQTGSVKVTYGHLIPKARVGDRIQPGQLVGIVSTAYHVDIKMRTRAGFIDWGKVDPFGYDARLAQR